MMSATTGPVSNEEIEVWKIGFYQVATGFVLWGELLIRVFSVTLLYYIKG
jgi:hypothetical protein